jgi:hypothetical protein
MQMSGLSAPPSGLGPLSRQSAAREVGRRGGQSGGRVRTAAFSRAPCRAPSGAPSGACGTMLSRAASADHEA